MKKLIVLLMLSSLVFSFRSLKTNRPPADDVPYPEGYRMWAHVKTVLIGPDNPDFKASGGYHHIYANPKAMQGYINGYFPNGSVIVFDVLDAREQNGIAREAGRKHIDVMVRDSLKYAATAGWGYEEFSGDSHTERPLSIASKNQCYNCHAQKNDFVFSEFRK